MLIYPNMSHIAKKSMGQNFLKSEPALKMMCQAGEVNKEDIILEIGPGKGALTVKLLEQAGRVIAVEKDRDLIETLEDKFKDEIKNKKLILLNQDILTLNLRGVFLNLLNGLTPFPSPSSEDLKEISKTHQEDFNYKIIANIPYNITGAIIKKFLSEEIQPSHMVLLVQKEVAERIVARDGKESILSLSVKAYGIPKYMMKVHKRFFSPSPKVDSAIISISSISNKNFLSKDDEKSFFDIIKAAFAHKRKVLRKNLESLGHKQEFIDQMFLNLKIDSKTRAEDLSFSIWLEIKKHLSKKI